jgi:5-methylcytosine-specific restriction endonuclease McrA
MADRWAHMRNAAADLVDSCILGWYAWQRKVPEAYSRAAAERRQLRLDMQRWHRNLHVSPARDDWLSYEPSAPPAGEYRARKPPSNQVRREVWQRDGGRCRNCGITDDEAMQRTGEHLQYDHIVPFSRNGADTVNNIQLLCGPCNRAKAATY